MNTVSQRLQAISTVATSDPLDTAPRASGDLHSLSGTLTFANQPDDLLVDAVSGYARLDRRALLQNLSSSLDPFPRKLTYSIILLAHDLADKKGSYMVEMSGPLGFELRHPFSSFFRTVIEVLLRPDQFFARFNRRELQETTAPVVFAVVCTVLSLSLLLAASTIFHPLPLPVRARFLDQDRLTFGIGLVTTIVFILVTALISLFVGTLVQHLLTLPFIRYGEGIKATFVVLAYGVNTISLLSWIPVVGYLAILYGLYVSTVGPREVHGTTTVRALIPALIFLALQLYFMRPFPLTL